MNKSFETVQDELSRSMPHGSPQHVGLELASVLESFSERHGTGLVGQAIQTLYMSCKVGIYV